MSKQDKGSTAPVNVGQYDSVVDTELAWIL
jgi:hypothetical protein